MISTTIKTLKRKYPEFIIGFEFEGYVKHHMDEDGSYIDNSLYDQFYEELKDIHPEIEIGEDGSIEPPEDGLSYEYETVELRTAPLPLKEGLMLLNELLDLFKKYKRLRVWGTNETCGFHINLSEKNIFNNFVGGEKFYCRMLQKFRQKTILRKFGRLENDYCNPISIKKAWRTNFDLLYRKFRNSNESDYDMRDKYLAIAFRNGERVEFRCLGNTNYELKRKAIDQTLEHIYDCALRSYNECMDDPNLNKELHTSWDYDNDKEVISYR